MFNEISEDLDFEIDCTDVNKEITGPEQSPNAARLAGTCMQLGAKPSHTRQTPTASTPDAQIDRAPKRSPRGPEPMRPKIATTPKSV